MPCDQSLRGGSEGFRIQRAPQFQRCRHVVGGAGALKLFQKPQPALGEGEWCGSRIRHVRDRRQAVAALNLLNPLRQSRDCWCLEEGGKRQIHVETFAQAGDETHGD